MSELLLSWINFEILNFLRHLFCLNLEVDYMDVLCVEQKTRPQIIGALMYSMGINPTKISVEFS
jgi:hypothetical protein